MMMPLPPFSGSYLPSDVTLLLDIVTSAQVDDVDPAQKERLIQTGQRHYSEMLTLEKPPSATHEALYVDALAQGQTRMAQAIADIAGTLYHLFATQVSAQNPLILVSLVRAGLPVGVLLQRALCDIKTPYHLASQHYGVSIIRDRGVDAVALTHILAQHPDSPVVFVDGWTGKGAIYGELQRSLATFNDPQSAHFNQIFHQGAGVIPLVTLADPAGVAWLSASGDDWLMPASLLNSTVSGLISRTLYRAPDQGLHQAVFYDNLRAYDRSLAFVATIDDLRPTLTARRLNITPTPQFSTRALIDALAARFEVGNRNRIKPTIAEATRALLRRDPECVLIDAHARPQDTQLLRHLCEQKQISIREDVPIAPYTAVTIIKQRDD